MYKLMNFPRYQLSRMINSSIHAVTPQNFLKNLINGFWCFSSISLYPYLEILLCTSSNDKPEERLVSNCLIVSSTDSCLNCSVIGSLFLLLISSDYCQFLIIHKK